MTFWNDHGTKILGAATAVLGTLASLITAGSFDKLLSETSIGWLSILVSLATAAVGGATMARGFNNSTQQRVAEAMQTAIMATPPKQGGFARLGSVLMLLAIAGSVLLAGCVTTPEGQRRLTPEGQAILQTSTRIAVRHYVVDSSRASQRVENLKAVIAKLQAETDAEATLGGLRAIVRVELDRLNLDQVEKDDMIDLLLLFEAALAPRLGQYPLEAAGVVHVNEFLLLVLDSIPEVIASGNASGS